MKDKGMIGYHPEQLIPHGHILRYSFKERLNHWVAAGSFIYLMLTGLAFWSPWLFWLATVMGGAELSRMLHPWIGLGVHGLGSLHVYAVGPPDAF